MWLLLLLLDWNRLLLYKKGERDVQLYTYILAARVGPNYLDFVWDEKTMSLSSINEHGDNETSNFPSLVQHDGVFFFFFFSAKWFKLFALYCNRELIIIK